MYIVISGSRSITDYPWLESQLDMAMATIDSRPVFVLGGAKGVDTLAERYATLHGIRYQMIRPDWDTYGKSAGFRRNLEMLDLAMSRSDGETCWCIAFWDGESHGTKHTVENARKRGFRTTTFIYNKEQ